VSFNAWFAALPAVLKCLVILGIVLGSLAVAASFVTSTLKIWKVFGDYVSRGKNVIKGNKERGSGKRPDKEEPRRDRMA
jgi:hypothetical protein